MFLSLCNTIKNCNYNIFRFDEDIGRVELDYPRDMAMWKGVGYNIDSVFQWKDRKHILFYYFEK